MGQLLFYLLVTSLVLNGLVSLPALKVDSKWKFLSSILFYSSGVFISLYWIFSFYMYHISPIDVGGIINIDFAKSGYLFILLFSFFLPVVLSWKNVFSKNSLRLFLYNLSSLFLVAGILLPVADAVIYFIGILFFFFMLLGFSFYITKKVWLISRILYVVVILLLLIPQMGFENKYILHYHEIFLFKIIILITSPFVLNLWAYSVIKEIPDSIIIPMFSILFFGGFYLLSEFLISEPDLRFHNFTAILGLSSALLSILTAYNEKEFKRFIFFLMTTLTGIALMMLGLSRYVGMSYGAVSAFYVFSVFIAFVGLMIVRILKVRNEGHNYLTILLAGVFLTMLAGFPPFSTFFTNMELLRNLLSYKMYLWSLGFGSVWVLSAVILLRWLANEYGSRLTVKRIKISNLIIPFVLGLILIIGAYINGYYINGFWGLDYTMFYILFAIYVVDLFLPRVVSGLIALSAFVFMIYKSPDNIVLYSVLVLLFLYFIWSVFDKKSKGVIPIVWLLVSSAIGVYNSSNVYILSFWLVLGTLASFLLLMFNRYDQISVRAAVSYLSLSMLGDMLIMFSMFKNYNGVDVLPLSEAVANLTADKLTAFILFVGFMLKLPITGINFWLRKISLEYISVAFFPLALFVKFFLIGYHCDCIYYLGPVLMFSLIYSAVKSLDADTVYKYLKEIILVSIDSILILFLVNGVNNSVLIFGLLTFVFVLFMYFVSLYMVMVYETDSFSGFGNFFRKNIVVGLMVYVTFLWFYGFGIAGAFYSDEIMVEKPALGYIVLFTYGSSLAYFMYSIFAEGVNVRNTQKRRLPFPLFLLIINTMLVIWALPFFHTYCNSVVLLLSSIFFLLLYMSFKYGNIATLLRVSKFFDMVRMMETNIIEKHFERFVSFISTNLAILYRDNNGLVFNIILFCILVTIILW